MKKNFVVLLLLVILLGALTAYAPTRYQTQFWGAFNTLIEITAVAPSEAAFQAFAEAIQTRMMELHYLFSRYEDSPDGNNLKTINDRAGLEPVPVPEPLPELIELCQQAHAETSGAVNIALGPVLALWHDAREAAPKDPEHAAAPDEASLRRAAALCDIRDVVVDRAAGTVFLKKAGMSLDLGAAAKGFAVELVAREMAGGPVTDFLINAGGNVLASGLPRDRPGRLWGVGIAHPRAAETGLALLDTLYLTDTAVVTSGDYERVMFVDGERLHHIIDPRTLAPGTLYQAVTIIMPSSARADLLSTALFLLPREEGMELARQYAAEVIWVLPDGEVVATPGAQAKMQSHGAGSEISKAIPHNQGAVPAREIFVSYKEPSVPRRLFSAGGSWGVRVPPMKRGARRQLRRLESDEVGRKKICAGIRSDLCGVAPSNPLCKNSS